jgi:hypothetical protein
MAWTTPRTWSPGETVTAALMNAQIRDNSNVVATSFVKGGAWESGLGLSTATSAAVWYCDHPATLTSIKALRKGSSGAAINARRVRAATALSAFFQVDGSGGPSYVDDTTDVNSSAAGDVLPFPASEDTSDYCLIGYTSIFRAVRTVIATAGTGTPTAAWEFWNGSTWAAISSVATITDGTAASTIPFTAAAGTYETSWTGTGLTGWAPVVINGSASLYWVRVKISAGSYTINPVLTQQWIIQGADHLATDLSLTTANEWMDGGTVANTGYVVGDSLELVLRSLTGSPTEVIIQAGMSLA